MSKIFIFYTAVTARVTLLELCDMLCTSQIYIYIYIYINPHYIALFIKYPLHERRQSGERDVCSI